MAKMTKERKNLSIGLLIFTAVIIATAVMGIILLKPSTEYIEGQADVEEYRVSSKVPGRILEFRVKEGQSVNAGDTLAILEAPDVVAKMEQARAAEAAAQAQNAKAIKGAREEQIQAAYEMWQKAQAGVTIAEKSYSSFLSCLYGRIQEGRCCNGRREVSCNDKAVYEQGCYSLCSGSRGR